MYRGYDIADIAEHSTYEDTAYLLLHGELPDAPAPRRVPPRAVRARAARGGRRTQSTSRRRRRRRWRWCAPSRRCSRSAPTAQGATDRDAGLAAATQPDREAADGDRASPPPPARPRAGRARPGARLLRELPDDALRRAPRRARRAHLRHRDDPARRARDERVDVHRARRRGHGRRPHSAVVAAIARSAARCTAARTQRRWSSSSSGAPPSAHPTRCASCSSARRSSSASAIRSTARTTRAR